MRSHRMIGMFVFVVLLATAPAIAQNCDTLDNGKARTGVFALPVECGGPSPEVPEGGTMGMLTTLFGADNAFAGNTFDLENIGTEQITIDSFDVNIDDAVPTGTVHTVSVYWKDGTSVGDENNPGAWTLLGSDAAVVSNGLDVPTPVAVGGLVIDPGQLVGIYVDLQSYDGIDSVGYTNGGPTVFADANLQLTTNTGQASPAFSGSFFPRQWNGTVYYTIADESVLEIPTASTIGLALLLVVLASLGFVALRRRSASVS